MESKKLKIAFIGAGAVNFGGHGNAWDHASRVEKLMNVAVVGIADINTTRAQEVLAKRRVKKHHDSWADTQVFADYKEMLLETKPDAVFIGLPPHCHGSSKFPVEIDCVKAGASILIEKPLSNQPPEEIQEFRRTLEDAERNGVTISVAYMFRYSKVIKYTKELAQSFGPIRYFNARYHAAYSKIGLPAWWNGSISGGPIVEQATHFADLGRYICGEVVPDSILCTSLSSTEPLGKLSSIPIIEEEIPEQYRPNRVTSATWKFESGCVGQLTHTVLLHEWRYELQLEVFGDGYYIYIHNPYDECRITVRRPGSEQEEVTTMPDDPYLHEVETFIDAVRTGNNSAIASSFADAFKTYELSWQIRRKAGMA